MAEWTSASMAEMARGVRERRVSPVELVRAHLERAESLQGRLGAFVHLDAEGALAAARSLEAALSRGERAGTLAGVPVSIKSAIDVAGFPCEAGSALRRGTVAAADAPLVRRLKAAGAIVLGNTNVPDMLMAYVTENRLYGRTNNPWDLERTPGGSSGGEAAAIAAGLVAGGVGGDGGGSIRVPAHFCGICGLKPTPGRVPATGHFPPNTGPFSRLASPGPMARSVADLELMFEVLAGPDAGDVEAAPVAVRRVTEEELRGIKIGFFEDEPSCPASAETRATVLAAAQALATRGYVVEPFRLQGTERMFRLWWNIFGRVSYLLLQPVVSGAEEQLGATLVDFLHVAAQEPPLSREELLETWFERDAALLDLRRQMEEFRVFLCPVAAVAAPRHGELTWSRGEGRMSVLDVLRYAQWFNLTGNPAVVVPAGTSREGLPIGVQVVARAWEDEWALAVARVIEQALGPVRCPLLSGA